MTEAGFVPCAGVGDDDLPPLLALTARGEVRAYEQEAGQLALRAGRRLERDRVEARHLDEDLLEPPHQLERALGPSSSCSGCSRAKPGQRREALVDPRVVLHRAGAERVEAGVDAEVPGRELGEVPHELELRHLGQARGLRAAELLRQLGGRRQVLVARQREARRPDCDFS